MEKIVLKDGKLYTESGEPIAVHLDDTEEFRKAVREGMHDWMDERYKMVGRWTVSTLFTLLFAAVVYFIVWMSGFSIGK
jgi:hypothetical protein